MKIKNICVYSLLSLTLAVSLSSCLDEEPKRATTEIQRDQRPTEKQLRDLVAQAANRVTDLKSRAISPNTRHEVTYNYDEKQIRYDEAKDKAFVPVTIRWKARKTVISDSKQRGDLTIDLGFRPSSYPVVFRPTFANDVTKEIATGDAASSSLTFDLKKK